MIRQSGPQTRSSDIGARSGASNTNDPIAEIDTQIEALATNTGMMPNRMVFGLPAWVVIRFDS